MKIISVKKEFRFEPVAVDEVSSCLNTFLEALDTPKKNRLAARLTIEDILLDFMDHFGNETEFTYIENNFLGKPYISINVKGERFNPLEKDDDDTFGNWSSSIINNADFTPVYSYEKGVNIITMRFSKKSMNPILKLLIAIVAAGLVSLTKFIMPKTMFDFIMSDLIGPIYEAFFGLMETVEVPLVFLSITVGILGIGDSSVFGKIGRKMVVRFAGIVLIITSVAGLIFASLFLSLESATGTGFRIKGGIQMILDIIPHSLIEPIEKGNSMQVAFLAIVFGVTLVVLGSRVKTVQRFVNEAHGIIVHITGLISNILPVFIFIIIVNIIWSGNIMLYLKMWKLLAAYIAVVIMVFGFCLVMVSYKEKVRISIMLKKMLPTFLIGLGTASSTALDGESSDCMSRKMGINPRFVDFGQPTGSVIFMPTTSINFISCAIFFASYYIDSMEAEISVAWLVIACVVCTFVSIATPPVPGSGMAAYTIIFSQLGLPMEAVAAVVSLDILFDLTATAFDSVFLQLELVRQADKNNMLNHEKLRAMIK